MSGTNHLQGCLCSHEALLLQRCCSVSSDKQSTNKLQYSTLDNSQNVTSIHRHQTPPRSRTYLITDAECSLHLLALRPLRPNVTSSIKPEGHNVAQCHHRRNEPRPQGICTQNFVRISPTIPQICSWTD